MKTTDPEKVMAEQVLKNTILSEVKQLDLSRFIRLCNLKIINKKQLLLFALMTWYKDIGTGIEELHKENVKMKVCEKLNIESKDILDCIYMIQSKNLVEVNWKEIKVYQMELF